VSELDFLLNRKKSVGKTSDSRVEKEEEIGLESRENRGEALPQTTESSGKSVEERGKPEESSGLTLESLGKSVEGTPEVEMETLEERGNPLQSGVSRDKRSIESVMMTLLSREPKIGVWSYPSFLVLQYLFSTKPGFRMSKIAKEALEIGLRQLYPELFAIAESVAKEKGLIK
jgi:hypothetical protein